MTYRTTMAEQEEVIRKTEMTEPEEVIRRTEMTEPEEVIRKTAMTESKAVIRRTTMAELDDVMGIYQRAVRFMQESGNSNQWIGGYPSRKLIAGDIEKGVSYVIEEDGRLAAVFSYIEEEDATYRVISQGTWRTAGPYATVHRLASAGNSRGAAQKCFEWCAAEAKAHGCASLRADTHEDNKIMQHLLLKNGFVYCGVIHLQNKEPRLAYERIW